MRMTDLRFSYTPFIFILLVGRGSKRGRGWYNKQRNKQTPGLSTRANYTDRLCGLVVRVPGYTLRGPGLDFLLYQIFWDVMGLERGPLSLMCTIEELLGRKSSSSGLENRDYSHWGPAALTTQHHCPQKLVLTSLASGGRSVGCWCNQQLNIVLFTFLLLTPICNRKSDFWNDLQR
jgi:hypothetical protein